MTAGRKKLGDFNAAGKNHEEERKNTSRVVISGTEGESGQCVNCEMLEIVRHASFRP